MVENHNVAEWAWCYRERRNKIREAVEGGLILWLGHILQPRNYRDNTYPFRQNSHLLYYAGLAEPDLALLSYPETDLDVLFSRPTSLDDIVWSGAGHARVEMARHAGLETIEDIARLGVYLTKARSEGLVIHYLPPYQASSLFRIAELLVIDPTEVVEGASQKLAEAVVRQRSVKSELEIAEIEDALRVTDRMHRSAMSRTKPGAFEYDIAGAIQGVALSENRQQAYNPIVTVRGEVLHNHSHGNRLESGQLLLIDAGAESPNYYASDITRTFPVNGKFTSAQADVYETVLRAQFGALSELKPGVTYKDIHLKASRILVEGLKAMGLMRGNPSNAVEAGAHALFFPHGLGHMLGLDVHDMEDLGDIVGYPKGQPRSSQFGLNFLRLSRSLEAGFVLTVEPGIYFIPALIDRWQSENKLREFIDYDRLRQFRTFGGIRIEDDVLITSTGCRILGPVIPKTIGEVESSMQVFEGPATVESAL
jgi:Xaa-Pro aminopeptidase